MPDDLRDIPTLLGDLTRKANPSASSPNRAITVYSVNNEILNFIESSSAVTTLPPFRWSDGSSATRLIWGQGEFGGTTSG